MAKGKLFQYAVILHEEDETTLLVSPTNVVAKSEEATRIHAHRSIPTSKPEGEDISLDDVEVLVRPF